MDVDPREYDQVKIDDNDVKKVLLGYLVHNCFKETAEAFIAAADIKRTAEEGVDIDKRKLIYKDVLESDSLKAVELTNEVAPGMLEANKDLHFDLLSIHYIELVRKRDCQGALVFAQKELTPFGKEQKFVEKLQDCMALLAYAEPEASPMFHLLNLEYRQNIAEMLNRAILAHANLPSYTSMERLIQQATVVRQRLLELNKDAPPAFSLQTFLKN